MATTLTSGTEQKNPEKLKGQRKDPDGLNRALSQLAAKVVADSFTVHSVAAKRQGFREGLANAMEEGDTDERLLILAGLKEAGLGFKKIRGEVSVSMRSPNLSNPDPDEFSSALSAAISRSPDTAVELLAEQGHEALEEPGGRESMAVWVENMEVALSHA